MQERKEDEKAQGDCSPVIVVGKTTKLILGKITCYPVKEIWVVRNKEVGVKASPFLLPFPVSPSLYFQLLDTQVCCLAVEKVGLRSAHNCSSLLLLPLPVFPLLWCGIWTDFRESLLQCLELLLLHFWAVFSIPVALTYIYILCIHKCWTICSIKSMRALPNGDKCFILYILSVPV